MASALSAIERARRFIASRRVNSDTATRILFSPVRVDLCKAQASVAKIIPYDLTPLVVHRHRPRAYGKQGVAVTMNNIDGMILGGPEKVTYPGKLADLLTGAYGNRGVVELTPLAGAETDEDFELVAQVQSILFPDDLGINDPTKQDNLFTRVSNHLEEVAVQYAGEGTFGEKVSECARICKKGNELARTYRLGYFRDMAKDAIYGPIPVDPVAHVWRQQLSVELPPNMILASSMPGDKDYIKGREDKLNELLAELVSQRGPQAASPAEAEIEARAQARAAEIVNERLGDFEARLKAAGVDLSAPPKGKKA